MARHSAEFGLSFCWRSFLILCRTEPAAVKKKNYLLRGEIKSSLVLVLAVFTTILNKKITHAKAKYHALLYLEELKHCLEILCSNIIFPLQI